MKLALDHHPLVPWEHLPEYFLFIRAQDHSRILNLDRHRHRLQAMISRPVGSHDLQPIQIGLHGLQNAYREAVAFTQDCQKQIALCRKFSPALARQRVRQAQDGLQARRLPEAGPEAPVVALTQFLAQHIAHKARSDALFFQHAGRHAAFKPGQRHEQVFHANVEVSGACRLLLRQGHDVVVDFGGHGSYFSRRNQVRPMRNNAPGSSSV